MVWLFLSTAWANPITLPTVSPCVTLERLPQAPSLSVPELSAALGSDKLERDPYGLPNVQRTTNFRISWGNSGGVSNSEIANLADSLEASWTIYIDELGHPQPDGTDTHLFNIFIGDSGNGAPDGYGAGGYYTVDPEGWPMIVVSAGVLDDGGYTQITGAHEFYHAIQGSLGTYNYQGKGAWFWEATATWGSAVVYPDNIYYASFLFSYVFFPHYPVNFFDYPDSGQLQEYYQYGSYIWPFYLSEYVADRSLIRDAWTNAGGEDDPLEALRLGLENRGLSLNDAWLDHLAINQVWDYPQGNQIREWVNAYANHYAEGDNQIAASHGVEGTGDWVEGPRDLRPRRYGSNAIYMKGGTAGTLHVYIEGEAEGDENSDAEFGARLVLVQASGDYEVLEIPFDGLWGEWSTDEAMDAEDIWLVVGAWTERLVESRWEDEEFGYRYALLVDEEIKRPEDTGSADTGMDTASPDSGDTEGGNSDAIAPWNVEEEAGLAACACAQVSRNGVGGLVALMALMGGVRRRR